MSDGNLIQINKEHSYKKNENNSNCHIEDRNNFSAILSNKSILYIISQNLPKSLEIKSSSIKRILANGQLEPNEYILFSYYSDELSEQKEDSIKMNLKDIKKKFKVKKKKKEEKTKNKEENIQNEITPNPQNLSDTKDAMNLNVKNKNENIFDPELPLLQNKISNTFSNIENIQKRYISLILCGNKVILSLDYLKCFYITLFFCGIFNLINFLNIIYKKNKINSGLDNIYHFFCFPLGFLLIITGIYGYKKINEGIYDDEICINLNNFCFISPICSFALSRVSSEDFIKKNVMMNFFINFISSFLSLFCIIILKEVERERNSEKNILHN